MIDYQARNVAQLGLSVYKRVSDNKREHVGDHPAAQALRWPNSWTPGQQFIFDFVVDFLIYDNAYALKFPSPAGLTLVNIPSHLVGLVGRSFYQPEGYRIWNQDGESFDFPVERVIHWRGKNSNDPRRGESKLETLREELASDAANRQAATELSRSGLRLPGWVTRPVEAPEWSEEAAARWTREFSAQAKKATREVPVLEEGMQYHEGGVTPEDAELLAARRFTREEVAGLYGMENVPPKSQEEREQFYSDVLPPLTEMCAAFLDLHVLIREYDATDHYFEFSREKLMDQVYKTLTSASGRPVLLTNEARAMIDKPPVPGGDKLVTPANVIVGDNPKPSTDVMPIQDPNKPNQDGSFRRDQAPIPAGRQASLNGHHPETKAALLLPRRVEKDRRRNEAAAEFESAIKGFLTHMERSLKSKQMDVKAIADDRWEKRLAGEIAKVARKHVQREGEVTAARLASSFDLERTLPYIETVSESKSDEIAKALRERLRAGDDAAEVFEAARNAATPSAAMTLATLFSKFATKEAAEQDPSRDQRFKTWIVTSANSEHPEMDGESVPLGATFSNGADGPPADHPGCQCLLEIDGGGHPPQKSIAGDVKVINQAPHPTPAQPPNFTFNIELKIPEGAIQSHNFVEAGKPAEVYINQEGTTITPAEVTIQEGAVQNHHHTTVEAAPTPDIKFDKGAISVESPVHVEAPPPADIRFVEGAIQANITTPDVNVEPPNVSVEVKGGKTKRTVRFSDGRTAEINEERE